MGKGYRKEWNTMAALGLVPDAAIASFSGYNSDIDINTVPETIWELGGIYTPQTTPDVVNIVSTDAGDNASGTGARLIAIKGLDNNYTEIQELIVPTGLTTATTTQSFLRINNIAVISSGSNQSNLGDITFSIGAVAESFIASNNGTSLAGIFTVPDKKHLLIQNILLSLGKTQAASADFEVQVMFFGTNTWNTVNKFSLHSDAGIFELAFVNNPLIAPPKSTLRFNIRESDKNNVSASVGVRGILFNSGNPL